MNNEASVGGFLAETRDVIAADPGSAGLYVLVIGGLTALGVALGLTETSTMALSLGFQVDGNDSPASSLFDLLVSVASIVGGYLLLVRFLAARGRLATGGGRFWPYLGMSILSALGIVFGLILLIVPGLILLVRWSAASGYVIGRGEGVTDALGASWRATKGHGWAIFFAGIVMFLLAAFAGGLVGGIAGVIGELPGAIASAFIEAAASAVLMAFGIAIYCVVADDTEQVSEVFA